MRNVFMQERLPLGNVKSNPQVIYRLVNIPDNSGMDTKEKLMENRRINLRRIKNERFDKKQVNLATAIGKPANYVSRCLSGKKNIGEILAREIEKKLQLDPYWMDAEGLPFPGSNKVTLSTVPANASGEGHQAVLYSAPIIVWDDPSDLPEDTFVLVGRTEIKVSAGNGCNVYEEELQEQPNAYRSSWVKSQGLYQRNLRTVYAHGDSMRDRICDGDSLLVDLSKTQVIDGEVYIIRYGDEIRVKRLFKRPDGGLIIRSDNKDEYPEVIVRADEMHDVTVVGMVLFVQGRVGRV